MVHQRQSLPLGLEAGDHLAAVHPRLEDLQRHLAADRLGLFRHEDDAEAAFADLLQQLVRPDHRAGTLADCRFIDRDSQRRGRRFQEAAGTKVIGDQLFDAPLQGRVPGAGLVHEGPALQIRLQFHGGSQNRFNRLRCGFHEPTLRTVAYPQCVKQCPTGSGKGKNGCRPPQLRWTLPYSHERAYTQ